MTEYENVLDAVIYEYDLLLLGIIKRLEVNLFKDKSPRFKHNLAVDLIRYVNETYWLFSPEALRDHLTYKMICDWHLRTLFANIEFPSELVPKKDLYYIAFLIYPDKIKHNQAGVFISMYEKILSGEVKRFPRGYFTDDLGKQRACACLKYAIEHYHPFSSYADMYNFFGTKRCLKFLRTYKLNVGIRTAFECPVDCLHYTLSPSTRNELLHQYYRFHQIRTENIRLEKERMKNRESAYRQANV